MPSIILASSSIYRKQLLQRLTNKFKVISPNVNEKKLTNETCKDRALRLATLKAKTISNDNNRMAFQLKENLKNELKPIITSLVMQGTVQLTPSGKIIILMRDNQTCGGYPRILQLTENAINRLSQKHMNNNIHFELV